MRSTANVAGFQSQVADHLTLKTKVVLIGIGSAQVRIDEIHSATAERQKSISVKIDILGRRSRGERIKLARVCERSAECVERCAWVHEEVRESKEGRLSVKLEIILALENVVENSKPAAHAGPSVFEGIPGKAETW